MKFLVVWKYPGWSHPLRVWVEAESYEAAKERIHHDEEAHADDSQIIFAEGYVEEYYCECYETGTCWVVRHPKQYPSISYKTKEEASEALSKLL